MTSKALFITNKNTPPITSKTPNTYNTLNKTIPALHRILRRACCAGKTTKNSGPYLERPSPPRNLPFKVRKVLSLPRNLHFKVHKVLCLPRNLYFKVRKILRLPRNPHVKVHNVLRMPRNLMMPKRSFRSRLLPIPENAPHVQKSGFIAPAMKSEHAEDHRHVQSTPRAAKSVHRRKPLRSTAPVTKTQVFPGACHGK